MLPFPTIGFVGTGTISAAMARGLLADPPALEAVLVSPRNAETAARLAADFSAVTIAADNQSVIDGSAVVVLAVRPQIAEGVIRPLRFREGQTVISLVAATERETLHAWIGAGVTLVQAVPLPFVERRRGTTALYPPDATAQALFDVLGTAVACDTPAEYDLLAAASALMASYFGIMDRTVRWLEKEGLPAKKGRAYLAPLFAELGETARLSGAESFDHLSREFATKGGLNEQVFSDFEKNGGTAALTAALDRVLARIRGR
ncbi:pyrroline-5-carboxylate reductase [Ensifer soli]|uniref:pyrroline-5-carboxylate reductase n=1 Tax=Ciceribacter sp. sgz301302 TaxID=3342379 RepID=UPI0035B9A9C0